MTHHNPNDMRRTHHFPRRDRSYGSLPAALALLFVIVIGFLLFNLARTNSIHLSTTNQQTERPAASPGSKPTPPATTPPK